MFVITTPNGFYTTENVEQAQNYLKIASANNFTVTVTYSPHAV